MDIYTLLKKPSRIFRFFTLPLGNKIFPLRILKNCVTPLWGNSMVKNTKIHGFSTRVFCEHFWKFHFFFNWPLEFQHILFSIPLEIPCPQFPLSPVWLFSGIAHCSWYVLGSHLTKWPQSRALSSSRPGWQITS